nr:hypothetical protein [Thiocapsa marina]
MAEIEDLLQDGALAEETSQRLAVTGAQPLVGHDVAERAARS